MRLITVFAAIQPSCAASPLTCTTSTEIRRQGQRFGGVQQESHGSRERGVCGVMLKSLRSLDSCRVVLRSSCYVTPSDRWVRLASPRVNDTRVTGSEAQGRHHHLQRARAQAAGASESRNAVLLQLPAEWIRCLTFAESNTGYSNGERHAREPAEEGG